MTPNAGATSATFTVPTVNDNTDEDDGFVQVYVNDGAGYIAGVRADVTVRDNDDPIPAISFTSADSVSEGNGTHDVDVHLTRRHRPDSPSATAFPARRRGATALTTPFPTP